MLLIKVSLQNETYAVFLFLARRGHVHKQESREMALSSLGNDDNSPKFFFIRP